MSWLWSNGRRSTEEAPAASASLPAMAGPAAAVPATGGVMGWFQSAGDWLGARWDETTQAVSDVATRTANAARDVWDVVSSTELSLEDGKLAIETDLDEVMDLLPERVRDQLKLDREQSENRVRLELDPTSGEIVASAEDLRIQQVDTEAVKTGAVHLTHARFRLSGADGLLGGGPTDLQASFEAEGVEAEDVEIAGPAGPVHVASVKTGQIGANVTSEGGLPFGDPASVTAGVSVEDAVVRGLATGDVDADEIAVDRLDAGLNARAETAFLETTNLGLQNVRQGGVGIGDASVAHARVDVRNRGGGLPLVDDAQDHLTAEVAVSAAGLKDLQSGQDTVDQLDVLGLTARWSQDDARVDARIANLAAAGVDTAGADLDALGVDGLSVGWDEDPEANRLDLTAHAARASGLDLDPIGGDCTVGPEVPLAFAANVGTLEVEDVRSGADTVGRLGVEGLAASGDLSAEGLRVAAGADAVSAGEVAVQGSRVQEATARGLSVDLDPAWNLGFGANQVGLTDLVLADQASIAQTDLARVSGGVGPDGITARVETGALSGVTAGGATLDQVGLTGLTAQHGAATHVAVEEAHVAGVDHALVQLGGGTATDVRATLDGGEVTASAAHAHLEDLGVMGVDVDALDATRLTATHADGRTAAGLASVDARGITHGEDTAVGAVALSGVHATHDASGVSASLDRAALSDARLGGTTVGSATADEGSLTHAAGRTTASLARLDAKAVAGAGATVDEAALVGLGLTHDASALTASLERGTLTGVDYAADGIDASLARLTASDADLRLDRSGLDASVGALTASNAALTADLSDSGSGPPLPIDQGQLIRSLANTVDDLDVRASAPLKAGTLDAGPVALDVEPGTRMDANLVARDGTLTDATRIGFSEPLDGPLWVGVRGIYADDEKLRADVRGFFDQDVGVSTDLGQIGDTVADEIEAPSGAPAPDIVDLDRVRASGSVGFGPGTIDAGVGHVTLGRDAGTISGSMNGRNEILASFAQLLATGFALDTAGTEIQGGRTTLTGGHADLDLMGSDAGLHAGVTEAELRDLAISTDRVHLP